ncbi:MAG: tyrosine--tRNA ligase [bacterium]
MKKLTLIEELKQRELFFDTTDATIEEYLEKNKASLYLGMDPTGDSMHVGHLVTFLVAKRFLDFGHNPILLIGGGTGLIGDPKQQGERKMLTLEETLANANALTNQVKSIFGFKNMVNNYDWMHKIDLITFLRDYGKCFNVNYMINKDTVKSRLDSGISYTEFSYQILQSLDWHHLYVNNNCTVQIGGQDQWGNITAGIELIRKREGHEAKVYGYTIPLITKSDGTKFGKTEGGAVWLDRNKTSAYEFYQFWINTADSEVIKRLKQFTFLSLEEIAKIEEEFNKAPHERLAQKTLAKEMTTFIHGEEALNEALNISEALFSGNIKALTAKQIEECFSDLFKVTVSDSINLVDALIELQLASSKRESRQFIESGAVSINGDKEANLELELTKDLAIENKYIVIRRGKKKYAMLQF